MQVPATELEEGPSAGSATPRTPAGLAGLGCTLANGSWEKSTELTSRTLGLKKEEPDLNSVDSAAIKHRLQKQKLAREHVVAVQLRTDAFGEASNTRRTTMKKLTTCR